MNFALDLMMMSCCCLDKQEHLICFHTYKVWKAKLFLPERTKFSYQVEFELARVAAIIKRRHVVENGVSCIALLLILSPRLYGKGLRTFPVHLKVLSRVEKTVRRSELGGKRSKFGLS